MMRHAKSSWSSDAPTDRERPLNKRGRRAAPAMARYLSACAWTPDRVLVSDARRTLETLERMVLPASVEVCVEPSLYHGGIEEVRAALGRQRDAVTILMLGHEPGWSEAVDWLSGVDLEIKTADAVLMGTDKPSWAESVAEPCRFYVSDRVRSRAVMSDEGSNLS
ncbi:MAG: histidine phosphatase family protein [Myxococcota bacterium]